MTGQTHNTNLTDLTMRQTFIISVYINNTDCASFDRYIWILCSKGTTLWTNGSNVRVESCFQIRRYLNILTQIYCNSRYKGNTHSIVEYLSVANFSTQYNIASTDRIILPSTNRIILPSHHNCKTHRVTINYVI